MRPVLQQNIDRKCVLIFRFLCPHSCFIPEYIPYVFQILAQMLSLHNTDVPTNTAHYYPFYPRLLVTTGEHPRSHRTVVGVFGLQETGVPGSNDVPGMRDRGACFFPSVWCLDGHVCQPTRAVEEGRVRGQLKARYIPTGTQGSSRKETVITVTKRKQR